MKTFKVTLEIRAECKSDAEELINDYTGAETSVEILEVLESKDYIYQCGSCEKTFDKLKDNNCPNCGSGNWVKGYIDDGDNEDGN